VGDFCAARVAFDLLSEPYRSDLNDGEREVTVQALKRLFDELLVQLDGLDKTKFTNSQGAHYVDSELFLGWCVRVRNLLSQACGRDSEHYRRFVHVEEEKKTFYSNHTRLKSLKAVFLAAREDYEGGYLRSIRSLVHAELFDDELNRPENCSRPVTPAQQQSLPVWYLRRRSGRFA
jgi:hypothetical protein